MMYLYVYPYMSVCVYLGCLMVFQSMAKLLYSLSVGVYLGCLLLMVFQPMTKL